MNPGVCDSRVWVLSYDSMTLSLESCLVCGSSEIIDLCMEFEDVFRSEEM